MPNYKMDSWRATDGATRRLNGLCAMHNDMIESDFPLTRTDVANAVAPERVRGLLKELRALGITSVRHADHVYAIIKGEGINLSALVLLTVQPSVHYCFDEQARNHYTQLSSISDPTRLPFDVSALDEATYKKLISWLNMAVRERRRTALTVRTVRRFLDRWSPTTYHLRARWPALAMLFDQDDTWSKRVRETPRNLNRWDWEGDSLDWYNSNKLAIEVSEQMLIGASLVTDNSTDTRNKAPVYCSVIDWDKPNNSKI